MKIEMPPLSAVMERLRSRDFDKFKAEFESNNVIQTPLTAFEATAMTLATTSLIADSYTLLKEHDRLETALHANRCHPDYEYRVYTESVKPDGEGWRILERDGTEVYWCRAKSETKLPGTGV